MTNPPGDSRVTPQAAVEAAAKAIFGGSHEVWVRNPDAMAMYRRAAEAALAAAVPLLCQPLQDEIDRLNKQLDTPPWRQLDAARTEIAQLRAVLASVEEALLHGGQTAAIRAQQALFALAAVPVGTGGTE